MRVPRYQYLCVFSFFLVCVLAKEFIKCLLNVKPEKRPTAEEALRHPWFTAKNAKDIDLLSDLVENFNARKTFKRAVDAVQAANRLKRNSTLSDCSVNSKDSDENDQKDD